MCRILTRRNSCEATKRMLEDTILESIRQSINQAVLVLLNCPNSIARLPGGLALNGNALAHQAPLPALVADFSNPANCFILRDIVIFAKINSISSDGNRGSSANIDSVDTSFLEMSLEQSLAACSGIIGVGTASLIDYKDLIEEALQVRGTALTIKSRLIFVTNDQVRLHFSSKNKDYKRARWCL